MTTYNLPNEDAHIVRLYVQTKDDRVMNGIGKFDDNNCRSYSNK